MSKVPHCTGCGEYPGEFVTDRIEELEAQIAAMEKGLPAVHMAGYMDGKKAAEAKIDELSKVLVEAMVVPEAWMVSVFPDMSSEAKEQITGSVMKARTIIAELKGQE